MSAVLKSTVEETLRSLFGQTCGTQGTIHRYCFANLLVQFHAGLVTRPAHHRSFQRTLISTRIGNRFDGGGQWCSRLSVEEFRIEYKGVQDIDKVLGTRYEDEDEDMLNA